MFSFRKYLDRWFFIMIAIEVGFMIVILSSCSATRKTQTDRTHDENTHDVVISDTVYQHRVIEVFDTIHTQTYIQDSISESGHSSQSEQYNRHTETYLDSLGNPVRIVVDESGQRQFDSDWKYQQLSNIAVLQEQLHALRNSMDSVYSSYNHQTEHHETDNFHRDTDTEGSAAGGDNVFGLAAVWALILVFIYIFRKSLR